MLLFLLCLVQTTFAQSYGAWCSLPWVKSSYSIDDRNNTDSYTYSYSHDSYINVYHNKQQITVDGQVFSRYRNFYEYISSVGNFIFFASNIGETAIDTSITGDFEIPSVVGNHPAPLIGDRAFRNCTNLTSVRMWNGVTAIGRSAFENCNKMISVNIPTNIEYIGSSAFERCKSLPSIIIPPGHSDRYLGRELFYDCSLLHTIEIYNCKGKTVGDFYDMFSGCISLKRVLVPADLWYNNLSYIDNRLTEISENLFKDCPQLQEIKVDGEGNLRSIDGMLYRENGTILSCPRKKFGDIKLSPFTKNIGADAFYKCDEITSIIFPSNITSISAEKFLTCDKLKKVFVAENTKFNLEFPQDIVCVRYDDKWDYIGVNDYIEESGPDSSIKKDANISITPLTRNFKADGGGGAILVSGSGTWSASASESWISLNSSEGSVGSPVAYRVDANANAEPRTGYMYVSGHVHTIFQEGVGADISNDNVTAECEGGRGTVEVMVGEAVSWKAHPNVDWLYVSPGSSIGSGTVKYIIEPYNEVSTRQGTITIAGNTFTVFQYGKRMKLDSYDKNCNYLTHVIPITVNALALTEWSVIPNASWISVVDRGNGKGSDTITIAVSENPSYISRTGTVTIGTDTFTVVQEGRLSEALSFSVSPTTSVASENGANGLVTVKATPDLPWIATSDVNWISIYSAYAKGAGNGNIVYSASPNSTLYERTGTITVSPDEKSGISSQKHFLTQPAAEAAISLNGYEFEASGESCSVDVSVANIVEWEITEVPDWITISGSTSKIGPSTVTLLAKPNDTVYPRNGTVTIARKTFTVRQKARGVIVEYDNKLFGTDGGEGSFSVHPDGNVSWTAVASDPSWIIVFGDTSGTGDGEVIYIVAPYVGKEPRTGTITVGDKVIYITQRTYDMNIEPNGIIVKGNNGEGEFGVSASIGDVWNAIVTEPWITVVEGYDSGTGNGTVRFVYTENNTGKPRTGKIIIAGEVYTLEQAARTMIAITATAGRGGKVSGGGSYDLGSEVTLTAIPDDGYKFAYWTGDVSTMQNPIKITMDVAKNVTAVFEPIPIVFESVTSGTDGVRLSWNNLAWATTYRIYRGVTSVPSSATQLAEIVNTGNCTYLDESGVVGTTYWYWIEAEGAEDSVMSDPMTGMKEKPIVISPITYQNLRGATHTNPNSYQEGTLVSFTNPSGVVGYTFAGWTPSQITADMTGAQTVRANWTANSYTILYNANGGSGTMDGTSVTYDSETVVAANGFMWSGHEFMGWATEPGGAVVYAPGQSVTNLTAQNGGIVTLYAVWADLVVPAPIITPPDGTVFTGDSCEVSIECVIEGVEIFYSISGSAPRPSDKFKYSGPFTVTDTTTIIAFARKDGVLSSSKTVTIRRKSLTLAEAAGDASLMFTTGGDDAWRPIGDSTSSSGLSVQSGAITDKGSTWIKLTVSGAGKLAFRWKVDCEYDYVSGLATWDHLKVVVDDVEVARIDGATNWKEHSIVFEKAGTHTVLWEFCKDDYNEEEYTDLAWISGVTWTPIAVIDPIPELSLTATAAEVALALEGSADAKLADNIKTAAEYSAYRTWALGLTGVTPDAVKSSPFAWLSYALNTDTLITADLKKGDVVIDTFESTATEGAFEFTVKIDGIKVGDDALEANIRKVFGIEGAAELSSDGTLNSGFSSNNVEVNAARPVNGNVKFSVAPKGGSDGTRRPTSFFFRVKMK